MPLRGRGPVLGNTHLLPLAARPLWTHLLSWAGAGLLTSPSSLQQCCDLGYHASLNRALRTFLSAELNLEQSKHEGLDAIENAVENLDATSDKQRLMEMYNSVFCPPMKFEFQPHMGDVVSKAPPSPHGLTRAAAMSHLCIAVSLGATPGSSQASLCGTLGTLRYRSHELGHFGRALPSARC